MRLLSRLEADQNPAQSGTFFSGNRLSAYTLNLRIDARTSLQRTTPPEGNRSLLLKKRF